MNKVRFTLIYGIGWCQIAFKHHAKNSKATREANMKAKTGQIDLFETK